jgi:2',3'-cyclic-nucleotide 2'-phosphodiesterase (5'-nucleotidase family)
MGITPCFHLLPALLSLLGVNVGLTGLVLFGHSNSEHMSLITMTLTANAHHSHRAPSIIPNMSRFSILHSNDIHGRYDGLARMASIVASKKAKASSQCYILNWATAKNPAVQPIIGRLQ